MCSRFRTLSTNTLINLILRDNMPHFLISYCQNPTRSDHVEVELAFPDPELPELWSCPDQPHHPLNPLMIRMGLVMTMRVMMTMVMLMTMRVMMTMMVMMTKTMMMAWLKDYFSFVDGCTTDLILSAAEPNFDYAVIGNHQAR